MKKYIQVIQIECEAESKEDAIEKVNFILDLHGKDTNAIAELHEVKGLITERVYTSNNINPK